MIRVTVFSSSQSSDDCFDDEEQIFSDKRDLKHNSQPFVSSDPTRKLQMSLICDNFFLLGNVFILPMVVDFTTIIISLFIPVNLWEQ